MFKTTKHCVIDNYYLITSKFNSLKNVVASFSLGFFIGYILFYHSLASQCRRRRRRHPKTLSLDTPSVYSVARLMSLCNGVAFATFSAIVQSSVRSVTGNFTSSAAKHLKVGLLNFAYSPETGENEGLLQAVTSRWAKP